MTETPLDTPESHKKTPQSLQIMIVNAILLADSRAHNFEYYNRSELNHKINLHCVTLRGAKIDDLNKTGIDHIKTANKTRPLLICIAAGINNLTKFKRDNNKKTLIPQKVTAEEIFAKLKNLKTHIKRIRGDAYVQIAHIPTLSYRKYNKYLSQKVELTSDDELTIKDDETDIEYLDEQNYTDSIVDEINKRIFDENSKPQSAAEQGAPPLFWNRDVRRISKRKQRGGNNRTQIRNNFCKLYDGLHATHELKLKWFKDLCALFNKMYDKINSNTQIPQSSRI